jgi:hypothetical protein
MDGSMCGAQPTAQKICSKPASGTTRLRHFFGAFPAAGPDCHLNVITQRASTAVSLPTAMVIVLEKHH